jgi:hypothetical protein
MEYKKQLVEDQSAGKKTEPPKIPNANRLINGRISSIGKTVVISIKMIDVENGNMIYAESAEAGSNDLIGEAVTKLAKNFIDKYIEKGRVIKIINDKEVEIGLGTNDQIEKGQEFLVVREEEKQEKKLIGKIKIEDAGKETSKASIVEKTGDENLKERDIVDYKVKK